MLVVTLGRRLQPYLRCLFVGRIVRLVIRQPRKISVVAANWTKSSASCEDGGFVLLLGLGGWYASSRLSSGFLPDLDEGTIVLDYHSPAGTDIGETDRLCRQMERIILAHPDVETYSRRTALGMSFKKRPSNFGDYLIQLKTDRKTSTPKSSATCAGKYRKPFR